MSGYLIAEVQCDGCPDAPRDVAEDEGSLRAHRADVRERGWSRRRVTQALLDALPHLADWRMPQAIGALVDLCPDCTYELKDATS